MSGHEGGRTRPSRLRGLALNLAVAMGVSVASLGAIEGLARVFEPAAGPARPRDFFPDWRRWEGDFYRFGAAPPSWPPAPHTNRDGLRDRHHTLAAAPGTSRVVGLGDSVTYGYELRPADAWPQVLQGLLDERGARVEVFNAAAPGWATRQERTAYRELMRKYKPTRVLLGICLNDVPELQNNLARPPGWLVTLFKRSALVRRVIQAEAREVATVLDLFRHPDARGVREGFERFFDELRGLRQEVEADGARLALVVFPFRFQVQPGAPDPSVQRRLCAFAAREGLACVDLLPTIQPLGTAGFIDACHLSPAGTQATARALVEHAALDRPPSFPELLRRERLAAAQAPALATALRSAPPAVRAAAAWALARGPVEPGTAPRVVALHAALDDAEAEVRLEALRALRAFERSTPGLTAARPALLRQLDDPHEALRLAAAETLWALGSDAADVHALAARLGHADAYVAAFAEASLQRLGPGTVAALTPVLADESAPARRRAARLLGQLGPAARPAVDALARGLDDPDRGVRRQSAQALGRIGRAARAALPRLEAAAAGEDPGTRQAARAALERVRAQ